MNSLIVGASAGLGRALAEELASQKHKLILVASDKQDLETLALDLRIRWQTEVQVHSCDLSCLNDRDLEFFHKLNVSHLFYIAGLSVMDKDFEKLSFANIDQLIDINFKSAVKIILSTLDSIKSQSGSVVGVGSVAQARARRTNTVYAASKTALEFFFQGLRHSLAGSSVQVQFYRMGFLDTSMNKGEGLIPKADPNWAAREIVRNLQKRFFMKYLPSWWRWIMLVYQSLPWALFSRMK